MWTLLTTVASAVVRHHQPFTKSSVSLGRQTAILLSVLALFALLTLFFRCHRGPLLLFSPRAPRLFIALLFLLSPALALCVRS